MFEEDAFQPNALQDGQGRTPITAFQVFGYTYYTAPVPPEVVLLLSGKLAKRITDTVYLGL